LRISDLSHRLSAPPRPAGRAQRLLALAAAADLGTAAVNPTLYAVIGNVAHPPDERSVEIYQP